MMLYSLNMILFFVLSLLGWPCRGGGWESVAQLDALPGVVLPAGRGDQEGGLADREEHAGPEEEATGEGQQEVMEGVLG